MAKELLTTNLEGALTEINTGHHTEATDVWAYGMLVYVRTISILYVLSYQCGLQELLTGDVPYPDLWNGLQVPMAIINSQTPGARCHSAAEAEEASFGLSARHSGGRSLTNVRQWI